MTTTEAIERSGIDPTLVRAIVRRVGAEGLRDVARGSADAGWPGFTYYAETVRFFKKHRAAIVSLVESMASDMGENPADMVAGFNCLAGRDCSQFQEPRRSMERRAAIEEYMPSVCRCLYGGRLTDDDTTVANALAWFALEEVARAFDE